MMADGTIRQVQDIVEGDRIMGDDSTPRNVSSLARGREEMYRVHPTKGDPFVVNKSHILCLRYSKTTRPRFRHQRGSWTVQHCDAAGQVHVTSFRTEEQARVYEAALPEGPIELSVGQLLQLSEAHRSKMKGYRTAIDFAATAVPFDPWTIGLWLGDGDSSAPIITTTDCEIVDRLLRMTDEFDVVVQPRSDPYRFSICGERPIKGGNPFRNALAREGLLGNKHIPRVFKCNSRATRLSLLAGIIDSDGHCSNGGYDIVQKCKGLAEDIVYVARSLGFASYIHPCRKGCWYDGAYRENDYFRITIYGDGLHELPLACSRKRTAPRRQVKAPLRYGLRLEELGVGDYYGFEIDGNRRFVLGDFTVTHNTSTIKVRPTMSGGVGMSSAKGTDRSRRCRPSPTTWAGTS
ncbi:MAG: hypothetical protein EON55_06525 [Alphaproteobacteria bacterium]|nr:MAG: hypothetical protein EON55_06525 [Alphaproteobacteria bacterium]